VDPLKADSFKGYERGALLLGKGLGVEASEFTAYLGKKWPLVGDMGLGLKKRHGRRTAP